jgi:hypothetical protein
MRWTLCASVLLSGLVGVAVACEQHIAFTLYRNSILPGQGIVHTARVHVATFDTEHGASYNRSNCEIARELFERQPGVVLQYWCEPGRFRP